MFHVKVSRIPNTWKEENILAAQMIYEDCKLHNELPVIMFSGGLDSNVVVESFRLAKVPYKVFIMRYGKGWNDYDIKYAIDWCNAYGVNYDIWKLNPVKFWQGDKVISIAKESRLISPQMCLYLYAATEKVDGYPILGFGEPDLSRESLGDKKNAWAIYVQHYHSFKTYFANRRGEGIFFHHTPEQQMSWYFENETLKFVSREKYTTYKEFNCYVDPIDGYINDLQCHKNYFYKEFYPNFKMRVPIQNFHLYNGRARKDGEFMTDYTGFDRLPKKIFDIEHELRTHLINTIDEFEEEWCLYDDYIYKALSPKFIDYYAKIMRKIHGV